MYGFEDTHCVLPIRTECGPDGHTVQCAALSPCWLTLRAFSQSLSGTILSWTTISIHFSTRLIIHLTKYPQWKLARVGLTQSHWLQPPPCSHSLHPRVVRLANSFPVGWKVLVWGSADCPPAISLFDKFDIFAVRQMQIASIFPVIMSDLLDLY